MMRAIRLNFVRAVAHASGHRIDLACEPPDDNNVRVLVVRRESYFPEEPEDGVRVTVLSPGAFEFTDRELRGETVYYYTFFPFEPGTDPSHYEIHNRNRAAALATAPYDSAQFMYELLPSVYRRYDNRGDEFLKRFLEIPGAVLDQLRSFASATRDLHDVDRVDARLLPLLAGWIGLETNERLASRRRAEIRAAPYMYGASGRKPAIEAVVKRLTAWESRTKEFYQNVFVSNRPPLLNIWERTRAGDGIWEPKPHVVSRDFAYEAGGRADVFTDITGARYLTYHTVRESRWSIWLKKYEMGSGWTPGQLIIAGEGVRKHPVGVSYRSAPGSIAAPETLRIYWEHYDETTKRRSIRYGDGPQRSTFVERTLTAQGEHQDSPACATDNKNTGGHFLIYRETSGGSSVWRYQFVAAGDAPLGDAPLGGEIGKSQTIPGDARGECDAFATIAHNRLYFFRTRRDTGRSLIVVQSLPLIGNEPTWSEPVRLGENESVDRQNAVERFVHLKEPYAIAATFENGETGFEMFYVCNRDGGDSIWSVRLNTDGQYLEEASGPYAAPGNARRITTPTFRQQSPAAYIDGDGATHLIFRSNASIEYNSPEYPATAALDTSYAGSTSAETRNAARSSLRGLYEDYQGYTYDTSEGENSMYSFRGVGLYLTPNTRLAGLIENTQDLLKTAIQDYLPIHARLVMVIESPTPAEYVYTYSLEDDDQTPPRLLADAYRDHHTERDVYTYALPGVRDDYRDGVAGWRVAYSWSPQHTESRTADFRFAQIPREQREHPFRSWHVGLGRRLSGDDALAHEDLPNDSETNGSQPDGP